MKKATKKLIATLAIVVTLGLSSISFVFLLNSPTQVTQNNNQTDQPPTGVIKGRLSSTQKLDYINRGYTIIEYHYFSGCCKEIEPYIEAVPDTVGNQAIVEKIEDDRYYVLMESVLGEKNSTPSTSKELLVLLCDVLLQPPIECGLVKIGDNGNIFSDENSTGNKTNKSA